ncbi:MAG TPA: glycosyltransferase, partial [Casimicrobiaceae bacterium]|nr:glycosyltransferase [Casimicrobiaceae bacterium]
RRALRELKPDIVHARSRLPAWLGWWAIKGLKPAPHFVTTVHGLNSPGRYSAILLRGERVIAVSQTLRDFMLSHYPWLEPARVRVIPRGIDPDAFPYGHRPDDNWSKAFFAEFPALAGAPLLTLPGRGTRLKGHHDAVELVAELKRRGIDVRVLMPAYPEVIARASEVSIVADLPARAGIEPCRIGEVHTPDGLIVYLVQQDSASRRPPVRCSESFPASCRRKGSTSSPRSRGTSCAKAGRSRCSASGITTPST